MRAFALVVFAFVLLVSGHAFAALPFDPDQATQAWLDTMGPEATARSNTYFETGYWLDAFGSLLSIGVALLLLFLGVPRRVRDFLKRTVKFYPVVVFGTAFVYLALSMLLMLPYGFYMGYMREHAFGLSNMSMGAWFGDYGKEYALSLLLGPIAITILYLIIAAAKNSWWIWGAVAAVAMQAFLSMIAPVYLSPIFNSYEPMIESPLKHDIIAMAQANGVPADNVYVYNRSRQTNSISANVSGLGATTRVSLADTLLSRASPAAVKAVMGHELGHYVLAHIDSLLVMAGLLIVVIFALTHVLFLRFSKGERWGIRNLWDPAGLPLFIAIVAGLGFLSTPIDNTITRFHEEQADMFGVNVSREPDGFSEASVLLSEYRKMKPAPWEEFIFYDHPSGWTRIHNMMVWKAHEIEAGRLPNTPGGPPSGWRPDFVTRDPGQSPAAPSN